MNKTEQTEYITKTIQIGNATICIHQPILSDKERAKREEAVMAALRQYGRAIYNGQTN
jgi:hypothetical protein